MVKPAMLCGPSSSGHEEDTRTHQLRISNSTSQNQHTSETQVKHTPHRTMHAAHGFFIVHALVFFLDSGLLKGAEGRAFEGVRAAYFYNVLSRLASNYLAKVMLSGSPGSTRAALAAAALDKRNTPSAKFPPR